MDFKFNTFEKWVVIFAIVMIISGGVNGCAKKPIEKTIPDDSIQKQEKEPTTVDTIGKIPGIVDALGCMFAPATCKAEQE